MRTATKPKIRSHYDILVVGGGFLGLCVAYEACRRGQSVLVVEKDSLCRGASGNTLRIVHGGFRNLQKLGLRRFRESQREQAWFLSRFPEFVQPLPCVLPLDGRRFRHTWVAHVASRVATRLSNASENTLLPDATVMSRQEIFERFNCRISTLSALVWHDAIASDPDGIKQSLSDHIRRHQGEILESTDCGGLSIERKHGNHYRAQLKCRETAEALHVQCPHVVICGGGNNWHIAKQLGISTHIMRSTTAFNLLFQIPPEISCGLAIPTKNQTYFAVPRDGQLAIGTAYSAHSEPTDREIGTAIGHLGNSPIVRDIGWRLSLDSISKIETGRIAAKQHRTTHPIERAQIQTTGLNDTDPIQSITFAVTPKYTLARSVAEKILCQIGCNDTVPARLPT